VNQGTQPVQPPATNCWDNYQFNTTSCAWVNQGTQPLINVSSATICVGQNMTITATPNIIGGTFLWNNSQTNASINVSPIVTTTYSVLYTINGCLIMGSGTVTVNTIPTINVTSSTICSGESTILTAVPSVPGGSYNWANNLSTTNSLTINPIATSNYFVIYTLNGCSSQSVTGTVTVNPIPSISVNSITICEGQSALLTASPSNLGGSYLWSPNGENAQTINISPNSTTNYSVIYTLNGCSSEVSTSTVTVNQKPEVTFIADQLIGCAPLTVQLESTSSENEDYSWLLSNGQLLAGSTTQYTFLQSGCYDVTLTTTENGCSNSLTIEDYICIENPPTAFFTTNPTQITDFSQPTSFINSSTGAVNYIWEFSDGQNSDEINPILFFSNNSLGGVSATLTVINELGCESSYSSFLAFNVNTLVEDSNVDVFIPNTFTPYTNESNQLFIPIFSDPELLEEFELNIFNRWGEQVFKSFDYSIGWDGTLGNFDTIVQDGVYIYEVKYRSKNTLRKKIVGHINLIR
jgi:gliding motility-associated-like protein